MKVCIIGDGQALLGKHPGGAELQTFLFAKAFSAAGFETTFIAYNLNGELPMNSYEFKIKFVPNWYKGLRGFRFILYRLPNFIKTVWGTDADYYFGRSLSYWHGLTLIIAKLKRKKYIFSVAHDTDIMPFFKRWQIIYKQKLNIWQLISAIWLNELFSPVLKYMSNIFFVQNDFQLELLKKKKIVFST